MGFVAVSTGGGQRAPRSVVAYAPGGLVPPSRRYTPPAKKAAKGKEERTLERGGAPAAAGKANALFQAVMNDPGVQQAQQKQVQQQQQKQAEANMSFWDKLGTVVGTVAQPLEYLNYPRRAIETGVLNLMEHIGEPEDWGNIFNDPAKIRGGRSNWDLIQGKPSEVTGKGQLGFGDFFVNMPKGPNITVIPDAVPLLPEVKIKPGETFNRTLGAVGDIGLDPFTRMGSAPTRLVNVEQRALQQAGRAAEAGTTAIDDLAKLLQRGGAAAPDIEEAVTRTSSQLTAMQRAQQIAAETKPGLREVELPRGRMGRANFVAELRAQEPQIYEKFKDELATVSRKGFTSASPELREALGLRTGIGFRSGMIGTGPDLARVPGTGGIARTLATPAEAVRTVAGKLPGGHWRDPEGLSQALDTLTRGKEGSIDDATARVAYENSRRVSEGLVRAQAGRQVRLFDRQYLRAVRNEGREAVAKMMDEAETVGNTPFNKIFADVLDTYAKVSGQSLSPEFLLDQSTYVPHRLTRGFKRYLREHDSDGNVTDLANSAGFMTEDLLDQAKSITKKRTFLPGTEQEIGGVTVKIDKGTISELNEVLKQAFPKFKGKFYEDDPARILEGYVTSRAKEAGNQAAGNYLANNPAFAANAKRISGTLYDEMVARDQALARDPLTSMLDKPYDPEASADFAQTYLGASRGPTDPAPVGPRLPETPQRTAGQVRREPTLPNQWVDSPDSIFRSIPDQAATAERQGMLRDNGADIRQALNDASVEPDWRRQARTTTREKVTEVRQDLRDLRENVMHGLRRQPNMDSGPIKDLTRQIKNARQQVRNWTAKKETSTTELEGVLHTIHNDIGNLEDELARTIDEGGQFVADASDKVRKNLESKLRQLKQVREEAQQKLDSAPARMRAEAQARMKELMDPVDQARKHYRQVEEETYNFGPSKRKIENAGRVLQEKAGSTYEADAARLAEIVDDPALKAEARALKSKFTHKGEHGAEGRARKTMEEAQQARERLRPQLEQAQRDLDNARMQAQIKHEAVVRGAPESTTVTPEGFPGLEVQLDIPPEENPGQVISGFEPGGDVSTLPENEAAGFGVGEERNVLRPDELTPQQRAAMSQQERRREQNIVTEDTLPTKGRTEKEAVEALRHEAGLIARGEDSELSKAVDAADKAVKAQGEQLLPGAISQHADVLAAKQQLDAAVSAGQDAVAEKEAFREAVVNAAADQQVAAQVGIDQRIAQQQDLETRRADLAERRAYHAEERKQVQRELLDLGKRAKPNRKANLEEMLKIYDDLELIGWANPQIQDAAMAQTEQLLNGTLDKLRSARAMEMTSAHVRKIVQAAYDGKLAPVMRSGLAAGWTLQNTDLKFAGLGDIAVSRGLHDQLKNLYKTIDDPKAFGRAFAGMTNLFKTYATLSPGFHVRNALSAIFMNTSDGVPLLAQAEGASLWTKFMRNQDPEWLAKQPMEVQQAFEATIGSGAGGRFGEAGFAETQYGTGSKVWAKINANKLTKASQSAGQWVEGGVRLGMALDTIRKGGTISEALERISRIHFDYGQISKMDAKARMFIPFWTFYSRNLPLQIEQMWLRPRAYSQFQSVMAAAPPDAEYTPEYWDNPGNWNTGAKGDKGLLYGNLDLPFTRSAQQIKDITDAIQLQPKGLLAQVNPLMAAPAELMTNSDFYTGQQYDRQNPNDYSKVSGPLGIPLNLAAKVFQQQDAAGRTYEPFTNAIMSILPMLDRTQRLGGPILDTGKETSEPAAMSWARFMGAPLRLLTPEMQDNEKRRRFYDQRDQVRMQQAIQAYLANQQAS